jgi:tetratricopeptide (TPR) repeat protein
LLHESGKLERAERVYRDAINASGADPLLLFNLGVLLEDMDRKSEAVMAYEAAVRVDPDLADGHYNLAQLFVQLEKPQDALRHMSQYRRLVARKHD